ncbi:Protein of unknown function DUF1138 [Ostreococcus tauri]|uniref:Uncharacterized protein n=1 Tax=Ostreococcus tauri TaxID=70448 RepID=A0A090MAX3_OSTTA|nr:Protein of unknown function DUF1138 [Ostreococcus tauri]CEF99269.1 Protein of unknown function DUF1138 [Ostreococcus tauri]|eukprot:XP_022839738.1 Protein of unknown function DUF1138 [Ostreococcus tauri]
MATSASAGQVLGSVAAMCAAGGAMYYAINVARVFGGETPSTINKEWAQATAARAKSWPREGSETPIALDPMSGARRA